MRLFGLILSAFIITLTAVAFGQAPPPPGPKVRTASLNLKLNLISDENETPVRQAICEINYDIPVYQMPASMELNDAVYAADAVPSCELVVNGKKLALQISADMLMIPNQKKSVAVYILAYDPSAKAICNIPHCTSLPVMAAEGSAVVKGSDVQEIQFKVLRNSSWSMPKDGNKNIWIEATAIVKDSK